MRHASLIFGFLLVAACGFTPDSEPRPIEIAEVPVETTAVLPSDSGELVEMWFVDGVSLVPLQVAVPDVSAVTVTEILVGGRPVEFSSLRSAIPPATDVLEVASDDEVVLVDLSQAFTLIGGDEEILAVGQLVLTLTSLDGISGVLLHIEGDPVAAPVGEGALVSRPLTADDFAGPIGGA